MLTATEQKLPLDWVAGTQRLSSDQLRAEQEATLRTPRRTYGLLARLLFFGMDLLYGRKGSFRKFKVLEVIARVPYQAWENVAYVAITHIYPQKGFAKRVFDRVQESRLQQDNEQWHLLILTELMEKKEIRRHYLFDVVIPQITAFAYYHISWLLFVMNPAWSYLLNADFEDHAEHEYMTFVRNNPSFEQEPFQSDFEKEYGTFKSLADLFRQIGYDERVHKMESLERSKHPRFS